VRRGRRGTSFGHCSEQGLEQPAAGQGIEAGHRFVKEEQVGALSHAQRERDEGLLTQGEPANSLRERYVEVFQPSERGIVVPVLVELLAESKCLIDP